MNILLICLFASMNLQTGHKKLIGSRFQIMLPRDFSRNVLKYFTERWIIWKTKYFTVERNVFSRLIVFRDRNLLRVHHTLHHNCLEKNSNGSEGSVLLETCCILIFGRSTKSCLQAPNYIWALLFPKNPFTTNLKLSRVAFSSPWRSLSKYSSW